jgi:hypothetical protein
MKRTRYRKKGWTSLWVDHPDVFKIGDEGSITDEGPYPNIGIDKKTKGTGPFIIRAKMGREIWIERKVT